jgi:uncharacterized protein related to proFAR isomerase
MNEVGRPVGGKLINDVELISLRRTKSRKACAEHFGVTEDAIKAAEARIKRSMNAGAVEGAEDNIDAMEQLRSINGSMVDILRRCNKMIVREENKMETLDKLSESFDKIGSSEEQKEVMDKVWNNNTKNVLAIQTNLIGISGEVRKQIELQLKIAETLYNLQMMAEFQNEIIDIIKSVDSLTAQKLIAKLKERRAVRGLLKPV